MVIHVHKTSKYGDGELLKEAKTKSTFGKTTYNVKGISACYLDNNDYYQYQVLRFYKQ